MNDKSSDPTNVLDDGNIETINWGILFNDEENCRLLFNKFKILRRVKQFVRVRQESIFL